MGLQLQLNTIRDLVAKDHLDQAIDQMSTLLKDRRDLDELIVQSARFNDIQRQIRLGTVDWQQADITKNRIRDGVLDLISEIEKNLQEPKPQDLPGEYRISHELLEVARALFRENATVEEKKDDKRKEQIASYYEKISHTLRDVVKAYKHNKIPHGECEMIRTYAEQLPETVGDTIDSEKAKAIAKRLYKAFNVEGMVGELLVAGDEQEALRKMGELEAASGFFLASADSLRAAL